MKGEKLMRKPFVYDKAKYHHDSPDFPKGLPTQQAFVHTGMFLGWVIDNGLYSEDLKKVTGELLDTFRKREVTGAKLFEYLDGVLTDEDLTNEGNAFAQYYFDFDKGQYLKDYERVLALGLPSSYHVEDSWENYEKIKKIIDQRYNEWKRKKENWYRF